MLISEDVKEQRRLVCFEAAGLVVSLEKLGAKNSFVLLDELPDGNLRAKVSSSSYHLLSNVAYRTHSLSGFVARETHRGFSVGDPIHPKDLVCMFMLPGEINLLAGPTIYDWVKTKQFCMVDRYLQRSYDLVLDHWGRIVSVALKLEKQDSLTSKDLAALVD